MINIRRYKQSDKEQIIALAHKIYNEIFSKDAFEIEDLDDIKNEYFNNGGIFLVAEDDNKIIGTIGAVKFKGKTVRLRRVYIHPDYRSLGIGKELFNKILRFCKNKKYNRIILSTFKEMKQAIKFYKKNGFSEFKKTDRIFFEKRI